MRRRLPGILLACLASAAAAGRAEDEATFDMNKGQIYALYMRELKAHPGLKGRLLLDLQIATDGRVANCRVVSSELESPGFGDKVCRLVRDIPFAPRPATTRLNKEISFFPAY
jgi:protein TonB